MAQNPKVATKLIQTAHIRKKNLNHIRDEIILLIVSSNANLENTKFLTAFLGLGRSLQAGNQN